MSDILAEAMQLFAQFSPGEQQRALELLRQMHEAVPEPERGSGAALLRHAGRISEEDGLLMEQAVEEMFEQIDPRDWDLPR